MKDTEIGATDTELIASTRSGDQKAFRLLVERYQSQIASTVIGILGQHADTDDVIQETFIRFYRSLGRFRADASAGTYLTRIAVNLAINELRRQKRRAFFSMFSLSQDPSSPAPEFPDPDASAEYDDTSDLVNRALQKLDPEFRVVVVLRMLEGYSTQETADILQIPVGTVTSRLSRGLQKLRTILTPYLGLMGVLVMVFGN